MLLHWLGYLYTLSVCQKMSSEFAQLMSFPPVDNTFTQQPAERRVLAPPLTNS